MASCWIDVRETAGDGRHKGAKRYRVAYRIGGRETPIRHAGSFKLLREARLRQAWVQGELAAGRSPDLSALKAGAATAAVRTLRLAMKDWRESRRDVRGSTAVQHRTAVDRLFKALDPSIAVGALTAADVAGAIAKLDESGYSRESIRKSLTVLQMTLDHEGIVPNVARDRARIRLPREEPREPEPPTAQHVEAVARLLPTPYRLALLVLDATGCRVGELEAARVGDLDEERQGWLVRAAVSKTRRPRWVVLPDDLWAALLDRLPPRDDRDPQARLFGDATADRLRMAILRACKAAGVPSFGPHALRHRRISLMHKAGYSWAEIGDLVGQRSRLVTADVYSHVLLDASEVDRSALLGRG
ncbi:MAG: tyrosine-type recombinase/integrase [Gaiellales bacterium]